LTGPQLPISEEIHALKYRTEGETFKEAMTRVADALKDDQEHFLQFRDILYDMRFLPAGRVQAAMGAPRTVTPYNCYVMDTIGDSMGEIMRVLSEAAETMRMGGGVGYDFSTLRPRGALIKSLDSRSSGPVAFMDIFNAMCGTIASAGHRRGAQMAVLRVDHPDIEEYVTAKANDYRLTNFNISVAVTDKFMEAVKTDGNFDLVFDGVVYKTIRAKALWDKILRNTWDWAEPGVLFIDRMNRKNNLWYCETISATNPCGEQPLPPYGACLLGSFNLTRYITRLFPTDSKEFEVVPFTYVFDWQKFIHDIHPVVRAMDNVVDRAVYPLPEQELEAKNKRRMGLGVTGLANTMEILGMPYGSQEGKHWVEQVMSTLRDTAYRASISLAIEKEPFPLYSLQYLDSEFAETLPEDIKDGIYKHGIRNSHLLSVAPTGTISLAANNVSSGIEPVFSHQYERDVRTFDGTKTEVVKDYAYNYYGVKGETADELSVFDHVEMLNLVSKYIDSACSKTCNVGDDVTWEEFKEVYMRAYDGGASGCTTFRASGKRSGILRASKDEEVVEKPETPKDDFISEGAACYIDPDTGLRSCE
jgi:ribonucleoside-diphosphate reductase alpha chain